MAAIQEAKRKGASVLAVSNVLESSIPRLANWAFYTHAGPEIGVASTKAFTTQLVSLVLIAVYLGRRNGKLAPDKAAEILAGLVALPQQMTEVVEHGAQLQVIARRYGNARGFLFLGRGNLFPIALEGALKLKEISYIHAEAYPAGELKHGPLALVDSDMPVVTVAPNNELLEKLNSNLQEVRARGGELLVFADEQAGMRNGEGTHVVNMPHIHDALAPILYTIPLQLLSYYVAVLKGTDVDQPRNLAKSVTVE
jgi:glucosamine--fructose-6-phosphate aminotransferase (isomerizing)